MPSGRTRTLDRRPREADAAEEEDDAEPGTWMVRADDAAGKSRGPGRAAATCRPGQAGGSRTTWPRHWPNCRRRGWCARPNRSREILVGRGPDSARAHGLIRGAGSAGFSYPEWDWQRRRVPAQCGSRAGAPAAEARGRYLGARHASAACAHSSAAVRRDFERLRPRRMALRRQPDGAELDVDAMVTAYADRRGRRGSADDRFYIDCRPVRRDAAIMLLVDTSASTDGWVAGSGGSSTSRRRHC